MSCKIAPIHFLNKFPLKAVRAARKFFNNIIISQMIWPRSLCLCITQCPYIFPRSEAAKFCVDEIAISAAGKVCADQIGSGRRIGQSIQPLFFEPFRRGSRFSSTSPHRHTRTVDHEIPSISALGEKTFSFRISSLSDLSDTYRRDRS